MTATALTPFPAPDAGASSGLRRDHDYRCVFIAAAGSKLGTAVSYLAVPLVAVLALHASAGEVGLLATLSTVAFLVIGLPAGAWIDRLRKRPVMVAADLARAALLVSVPVAWLLGVLTMYQLDAVVLATGACTVFFDVASQSYLPCVVGRDRLGQANSQLVTLDAVAQIGGRGAAGYLAALAPAPLALVIDAASYLWSAALLGRVRQSERRPGRSQRGALREEIWAGAAFVVRHPVLRPIAISGALANLAIQICQTLLPVELVDLGMSAAAIGLFFSAGGIGVLLGSLAARPLARRLGSGRVLWLLGLVVAPAGFFVALIGRGPALWLAAVAWMVTTFKTGADNVIKVSFRQSVTPEGLLDRMNATMRFLLTGALSLGAALSGFLGEVAGVRAALWAGAAVLALVWVPAFFSPMRSFTDLPG